VRKSEPVQLHQAYEALPASKPAAARKKKK